MSAKQYYTAYFAIPKIMADASLLEDIASNILERLTQLPEGKGNIFVSPKMFSCNETADKELCVYNPLFNTERVILEQDPDINEITKVYIRDIEYNVNIKIKDTDQRYTAPQFYKNNHPLIAKLEEYIEKRKKGGDYTLFGSIEVSSGSYSKVEKIEAATQLIEALTTGYIQTPLEPKIYQNSKLGKIIRNHLKATGQDTTVKKFITEINNKTAASNLQNPEPQSNSL